MAEAHGYLTFLGYLFMTWDCRPLPPPKPLAGASVDFFIPTYNEAFSVLAPTIAGAVAIPYPHTTYVLDDGCRAWVRRLCRCLGAKYMARPTNENAKAGNLNFALARSNGEFIAVVDADFVPSPGFISSLIGYFRDPKVAFVQAPQEFYNRDSFQHLKGDADAWHEQALFFRTIQAGKNRWNAAFWCGCPSILRRSALESVGGVATETVTEDLHTSIRLHAAGWKSVYHPGLVAAGIAPNDYDGFILQRLRWAEGTMQVIRKEWLRMGLSLAQAVNYLASTGTYFDALRKAVFLSIVPLVLVTDTLPVDADASVFLPIWTLQFILGSIANHMLGRGNNRFLMTDFFDLMKMFAFIQATFTLLSGKRVRFRVTPKSTASERKLHRLLVPYAILVVLYITSIAVGLARVTGVELGTRNPLAQVGALLWATAILAFLTSVVVYGYRKVNQRSADRIPTELAGTYRRRYGRREYPIILSDLTTEGCAFLASTVPNMGERVQISISSMPQLTFPASVRRIRAGEQMHEAGLVIQASEAVQTKIAALIACTIFSPETGRAPRSLETKLETHELAA